MLWRTTAESFLYGMSSIWTEVTHSLKLKYKPLYKKFDPKGNRDIREGTVESQLEGDTQTPRVKGVGQANQLTKTQGQNRLRDI